MPASLNQGRALYVERVYPNFGVFLAVTSLMPAIAVVLAPFSVAWGLGAGAAVTVIAWLGLILSAPRLKVTDGTFQAGPAALPTSAIAEVIAVGPDEIFTERGPGLNARAFTLFQGSVKTAIKIHLEDEIDPTPYWLISTRNPAQLKAILDQLKNKS